MKKAFIWTMVLVVLIIGVYGIFRIAGSFSQSEDSRGIGVILPLSGDAAYYGEASQRGIEIAREEISKEYPGFKFDVYYDDSQYTPKGGVSAYSFLKNTYDIDAVITAASQVSLGILPLTTEDKIIQMAIFSSANKYSVADDLSFRVSTKNDIEAEAMAEFIKKQNYDGLAIIYLNNDFGVGFKDSLKTQLVKKDASTEVVAEEAYMLETNDFRTSLLKIKEARPDAIFMVGTAAHYSLILKQAKELGIEAQFLSMRSAEDPVLLKNAASVADGLIYSYPFDATGNAGEIKSFVEKFISKYGTVPDAYAAEGYEGFKLVALSLIECGEDDYECIKDYFVELEDYSSVFGPISFDRNGDVYYSFFMKIVKDGKFVPLSL